MRRIPVQHRRDGGRPLQGQGPHEGGREVPNGTQESFVDSLE
jgi:hypothetical protein